MIAERRRRLESLCLEALAKDPESRAGFLDAACGTDAEVRREVESLLGCAAETGGFLESVQWETDSRPLPAGTQLGSLPD